MQIPSDDYTSAARFQKYLGSGATAFNKIWLGTKGTWLDRYSRCDSLCKVLKNINIGATLRLVGRLPSDGSQSKSLHCV